MPGPGLALQLGLQLVQLHQAVEDDLLGRLLQLALLLCEAERATLARAAPRQMSKMSPALMRWCDGHSQDRLGQMSLVVLRPARRSSGSGPCQNHYKAIFSPVRHARAQFYVAVQPHHVPSNVPACQRTWEKSTRAVIWGDRTKSRTRSEVAVPKIRVPDRLSVAQALAQRDTRASGQRTT